MVPSAVCAMGVVLHAVQENQPFPISVTISTVFETAVWRYHDREVVHLHALETWLPLCVVQIPLPAARPNT